MKNAAVMHLSAAELSSARDAQVCMQTYVQLFTSRSTARSKGSQAGNNELLSTGYYHVLIQKTPRISFLL